MFDLNNGSPVTQEKKDKKMDRVHKKMLVILTGFGILSFALSSIINYYNVKKLVKK